MSADKIAFLTVEDVLDLHAIAIADQGGDSTLRDRGLLESALAIPQQQFGGVYLHNGVPEIAAAYAFHLCKNHPFADGNKRAALAAMVAFLTLNDWRLDADNQAAETVVTRLAQGDLDKTTLSEWVAANCHAKPTLELRRFFGAFDPLAHYDHILAFNRGAPGEQNASLEDAARAIPVVTHLKNRAMERETAGDQESVLVFRSQLLLLVAVYRMAEDMGYEW